ncbi:uncharacterized protein LOC142356491, partial [Convolutriloba macropyga]|uniref:uncharacterized protein LOC142356491 n=1 Tax=Convolutriloba macropyga TaxID=536237 RepID=UPI003F51EBFB
LHSFEEVRHGTKLSNVSIIEELQVSSRMECSQRCVSTPKCRSVNLCYRKVCQLNTGDLFSKGVQMQSSFHCLFVGMKQTFVPVCNEKGACNINQKRADAEWGEWRSVTDWTYPSITRHIVRTCHWGHLPVFNCENEEWALVDKIVLPGVQRRSFYAANEHCLNKVAGQLWGDIEEPDINLHDVRSFFGISRLMVGVTDWRTEGTFYNLRGKNVSETVQQYNAGYLDNNGYAQHSIIVRSRADLNIIDDGSMVYTEEFVCQQVFSHLEPW